MTVGEGTLLKDTYVVERELGRGGMGVVWEARHKSLDNLVCVKVLHRHVATDALSMARFEREAKAMAKIDSPHVVRVLDYGVTGDDEPFIVMERLVGRDLHQTLDERRTLPLEDVDRLLRQLDRALGWAHDEGIVHRDIKLANTFVLADHDELYIKLLDFGLAKVTAEHDLELTGSTSFMGTPYYMSPEQFVDPRNLDHRSDLWSIGVVAYACITGALPFDGKTIGGLSLAVHKGEFPAPSTLVKGLPRALDAFFARVFAVEPDDRHASAAEMHEAFRVAAAMSLASSSGRPRTIVEPAKRGLPASDSTWLASDEDANAISAETVSASSPRFDESDEAPDTVRADEASSGSAHDASSVAPVSDERGVPHASTANEAPPVTLAEDAPPTASSPPRFVAVAVALVAVVGGGVWLSRDGDLSPAAGSSPVPIAADAAPAPSVATVEARIAIEPPGAEVEVDGEEVPIDDGILILRGHPGDAFEITVFDEERRHTTSVVLSKQGEASQETIALDASSPPPSPPAAGIVSPGAAPRPRPAAPPHPSASPPPAPPPPAPPPPPPPPPLAPEDPPTRKTW